MVHPVMAASVVAVDVGKHTAVLSVTSAARHRLLGPVEFAMTAPAVAAVVQRVCAVLPGAAVKVGVEAAGHLARRPGALERRGWGTMLHIAIRLPIA
jgi:transposase